MAGFGPNVAVADFLPESSGLNSNSVQSGLDRILPNIGRLRVTVQNRADVDRKVVSRCPLQKSVGRQKPFRLGRTPTQAGAVTTTATGNAYINCGNHFARSCDACQHTTRGVTTAEPGTMCGGECVWLKGSCQAAAIKDGFKDAASASGCVWESVGRQLRAVSSLALAFATVALSWATAGFTSGQISSRCDRSQAKSGEDLAPISAGIGVSWRPSAVELGPQGGQVLAQVRPSLGDLHVVFIDLARIRSSTGDFNRTWPELGQLWPEIGHSGSVAADFGPDRSDFDQPCPVWPHRVRLSEAA